MRWRPHRSTRTDTLVPYTTLFRSSDDDAIRVHSRGVTRKYGPYESGLVVVQRQVMDMHTGFAAQRKAQHRLGDAVGGHRLIATQRPARDSAEQRRELLRDRFAGAMLAALAEPPRRLKNIPGGKVEGRCGFPHYPPHPRAKS